MAEYPRYQSKGQLTTQQPSVMAPASTDGEILNQAAKVGQNVQDIAFKWGEAVNTIQKTAALANFKTGIEDIHNRAQNDPNYNNSDQYFQEIDKLKTENLKGFSSPMAQKEMNIELGYQSSVSKIQVQNLYKKKMIDVGQTATLDLIKQETDNPNESSFQNVQKVLNEQVNANLISHEDAFKLAEKASKEIGINRVYKDLNSAQSQQDADQVAQNIKSGVYDKGGAVLSPEEKGKLVTHAQTMGRQLERKENFAGRMQRESATHDLTDQANNGILKGQTLEEAFLTKQISNTTYTALSDNAISTVGPTAGTDHQTYYDLTHYLLSGKATPEEAVKRILDANSQGKLSRDDQKKLYEMHLVPSSSGRLNLEEMVGQKPRDEFDAMKAAYDERIKQINDKRGWFKPAFRSFNEYFSGPNKTEQVVNATKQLIDNVQQGKIADSNIPAEADKIIGQSILQKHPEWAKFPATGQAMHDRFGNKVTVFPDGRIVRRK